MSAPPLVREKLYVAMKSVRDAINEAREHELRDLDYEYVHAVLKGADDFIEQYDKEVKKAAKEADEAEARKNKPEVDKYAAMLTNCIEDVLHKSVIFPVVVWDESCRRSEYVFRAGARILAARFRVRATRLFGDFGIEEKRTLAFSPKTAGAPDIDYQETTEWV